jgi:hypothetical protein
MERWSQVCCTTIGSLSNKIIEHKQMTICWHKDAFDSISANGSHILKWWVDASFAVHPNFCTDILTAVYPWGEECLSSIVAADDFMPAICWT